MKILLRITCLTIGMWGLFSFHSSNNYHIVGTSPQGIIAEEIVLYVNGKAIDTAAVKDNKFTFHGTAEETQLARFRFGKNYFFKNYFFVETREIAVTYDTTT